MDGKVLPKKYQRAHIIDKISRFLVQKKHIQNPPPIKHELNQILNSSEEFSLNSNPNLVAKNGMEGSLKIQELPNTSM
jgi:hypothetical protein